SSSCPRPPLHLHSFPTRRSSDLGVRYDRHNMFGSHVSPRAYLVWAANERWTVKGGISTGYKTPRPDQLFPGVTGFGGQGVNPMRSEEHTSELQSRENLVCRLLLE